MFLVNSLLSTSPVQLKTYQINWLSMISNKRSDLIRYAMPEIINMSIMSMGYATC